MPFPPAHMLLGAGLADIACSAMPNPPPRHKVWAVGAFLGALPDVDIILGILLGKGGAYHGTFTHSITAVVLWTLIGYAIGEGRWAAVFFAGYGSHLLGDLLDESGPTNLMLGWPFIGTKPYSIGKLFPKIPVKGDGLVETAMYVLQPKYIVMLVIQTAMAAAICAALMLIATTLRRRRRARPSPAG